MARAKRVADDLQGLLAALQALKGWLTEAGVGFAVVGGVAASLHGRPRLTKDVDAVAIADDARWAALLRAGKRHGLEPRIADALAFARTTRVLLLVHAPSRIEVDLSFGMLPFETELVARAESHCVRRVSFPVATAEDILVMKALALRPRDVADIEGILAIKKGLDLARVRRHLARLSQALETEDHVARFDDLVRRVRGK